MQKRILNRFVVAAVAAGALALGSFAPTTAVADNPNAEAALSVVFDDGYSSMFEVVTTPEHVGEQFMVLQGPMPGIGAPVNAGMIMPGATYFAIPTALPGMYTTVMTESFLVTASQVEFPPEGD